MATMAAVAAIVVVVAMTAMVAVAATVMVATMHDRNLVVAVDRMAMAIVSNEHTLGVCGASA